MCPKIVGGFKRPGPSASRPGSILFALPFRHAAGLRGPPLLWLCSAVPAPYSATLSPYRRSPPSHFRSAPSVSSSAFPRGHPPPLSYPPRQIWDTPPLVPTELMREEHHGLLCQSHRLGLASMEGEPCASPRTDARFERVRCLKACHLDDPPRGPLLQPPHTFSLTVRPIFRSIRQVD